MNLPALRKSGAPIVPDGIRARGFGAVFVDALVTFFLDAGVPEFTRGLVREHVALEGGVPENVEIVNFAEEVLQVLEVVAPKLVFLRKKIFDDIAEAFDADAQAVEGNLRASA